MFIIIREGIVNLFKFQVRVLINNPVNAQSLKFIFNSYIHYLDTSPFNNRLPTRNFWIYNYIKMLCLFSNNCHNVSNFYPLMLIFGMNYTIQSYKKIFYFRF